VKIGTKEPKNKTKTSTVVTSVIFRSDKARSIVVTHSRAAPAQNERGRQNEKIETYGYNFRSLWHMKCSIISTPKAWCTPAIITRKSLGLLVDSERACALWGKCRIYNVG